MTRAFFPYKKINWFVDTESDTWWDKVKVTAFLLTLSERNVSSFCFRWFRREGWFFLLAVRPPPWQWRWSKINCVIYLQQVYLSSEVIIIIIIFKTDCSTLVLKSWSLYCTETRRENQRYLCQSSTVCWRHFHFDLPKMMLIIEKMMATQWIKYLLQVIERNRIGSFVFLF